MSVVETVVVLRIQALGFMGIGKARQNLNTYEYLTVSFTCNLAHWHSEYAKKSVAVLCLQMARVIDAKGDAFSSPSICQV